MREKCLFGLGLVSLLFLTFIHVSFAASPAPASIAGRWQFDDTFIGGSCGMTGGGMIYETQITESGGQINMTLSSHILSDEIKVTERSTISIGTFFGSLEGYEINLSSSTQFNTTGVHGDETLRLINGSGTLSNDCNSFSLVTNLLAPTSSKGILCIVVMTTSATKLDNFGCIYPDAMAPITTASAFDDTGAAYTFGAPKKSTYINIALSCDDGNGTGCSLTKYCIDFNNQCAPSQTYSMPIQISNQGVSYIRYYSTDNAGNKEAVNSQIVFIDNTLPTIEVIEPAPGIQLSNKTIEVELTVSDASLNHTTIEVLKGDEVVASTTSEEKGTFTVNLTVPADGKYKIVATAYDNALNNKSVDIANVVVKTPCGEVGRTCVFGTDCCSGACSDGKCIAAIVRPTEQPTVQDNTMLFIGIIVAIAIVVGIVAYLLLIKKKLPAQPPAQQV